MRRWLLAANSSRGDPRRFAVVFQMHALNKPQFDQVECHMPHKLQPVPPIIQPELAARAGLWTASHLLQEMFVPMSSIKVIFANKMARILLNPDLGRKGLRGAAALQTDACVSTADLLRPVSDKLRVRRYF